MNVDTGVEERITFQGRIRRPITGRSPGGQRPTILDLERPDRRPQDAQLFIADFTFHEIRQAEPAAASWPLKATTSTHQVDP